MALLKAYEKFQTGESYPNAYHRVLAVNINVEAGGTEVSIGIYRDEAARRVGKQPVMQGTCAAAGDYNTELFSDEALAKTTPVRAAYVLLRRQEAYAGAKDV